MKKMKRNTTATILTLSLLLSGTYAWQNINQVARSNNQGLAQNPGGRLHDDFDGEEDKNVYIENYRSVEDGGMPIYGRVRLDEYMELGLGAGVEGEDRNTERLSVLRGAILNDSYPDLEDKTTWDTYEYSEKGYVVPSGTRIGTYRTLGLGGQGFYLPTTNTDNESLEPEYNGTWKERYTDYVAYTAKDPGVKETPNAKIMSMNQWLELSYTEQVGPYWVYDEDGWAYWADEIAPGESTGLLVDYVVEVEEPPSEWYYGVNVVSQLSTAGEWGDPETENSLPTGMYNDGGLSKYGLYLLNKISGQHSVELVEIMDSDGARLNTKSVNMAVNSSVDFTVRTLVSYEVGMDFESEVMWAVEEIDGPGLMSQEELNSRLTEGRLRSTSYMKGGTYRITATSVLDATVFDYIDVKVIEDSGTFTIDTARGWRQIEPGDKEGMVADFADMDVQDVTWALEGKTSQGTWIDKDTGVITIAEDEELETWLTITGTPAISTGLKQEFELLVDTIPYDLSQNFEGLYAGDEITLDGRTFYIVKSEVYQGRDAVKLFLKNAYTSGIYSNTSGMLANSDWSTSRARLTTLPSILNSWVTISENIATTEVSEYEWGSEEIITVHDKLYLYNYDEFEEEIGLGSAWSLDNYEYYTRTPTSKTVMRTITKAGAITTETALTGSAYYRPVFWLYI